MVTNRSAVARLQKDMVQMKKKREFILYDARALPMGTDCATVISVSESRDAAMHDKASLCPDGWVYSYRVTGRVLDEEQFEG